MRAEEARQEAVRIQAERQAQYEAFVAEREVKLEAARKE